jgi:hypothetical protein
MTELMSRSSECRDNSSLVSLVFSDLLLLLPKKNKRLSEGNEKVIELGGMNPKPNLGSSGSNLLINGYRLLLSLPNRLLQTLSITPKRTPRDCLSLPSSDGPCKPPEAQRGGKADH